MYDMLGTAFHVLNTMYDILCSILAVVRRICRRVICDRTTCQCYNCHVSVLYLSRFNVLLATYQCSTCHVSILYFSRDQVHLVTCTLCNAALCLPQLTLYCSALISDMLTVR